MTCFSCNAEPGEAHRPGCRWFNPIERTRWEGAQRRRKADRLTELQGQEVELRREIAALEKELA